MSLAALPELTNAAEALTGPGLALTAGLAVLFVGLAALEMAWPQVRRPVEAPGRLLTNFALGALNFGLGALAPLSIPAAALLAARNGWGLFNLVEVPAWATVAATVLIASLAQYLFHRAAHAWPLLWRLHRIHHADTAVDLSTTLRNHPFELLFVIPWLSATALAFGLSAPALAAYQVVALGFGLWGHANLRLPPAADRLLRLVLVTPPMHHLHHSVDRHETDSNFGDVFSLWDHLFRTHVRRPAGEMDALRRGLGDADDAAAGHLGRQLIQPFGPTRPGAVQRTV